MKRALFVFAFAVLFAGCAHRASATTCSVPNTFTNGTTADASQVNANFSSLQTCGNNIDHNNIGAAGIYATQIVPTTVGQSIFGGSVTYQFSNGLIVNGGLTLGTPLGQSDIANGYVDLSSNQTINGNKAFAGNVSTTAQLTGYYVQSCLGAPGTCAYVPPVYNNSGGSLGSATHAVFGTLVCTTNSGGGCNATVTLSGSAVFSSGSSYACALTDGSAAGAAQMYISTQSATAFNINIFNGVASTPMTMNYLCMGT